MTFAIRTSICAMRSGTVATSSVFASKLPTPGKRGQRQGHVPLNPQGIESLLHQIVSGAWCRDDDVLLSLEQALGQPLLDAGVIAPDDAREALVEEFLLIKASELVEKATP